MLYYFKNPSTGLYYSIQDMGGTSTDKKKAFSWELEKDARWDYNLLELNDKSMKECGFIIVQE